MAQVRCKLELEFEDKFNDDPQYDGMIHKPWKDYLMADIKYSVEKPLDSKLLTLPSQFNCNLHEVDYPIFAMAFPSYMSYDVPNNFWMEEAIEKGEDTSLNKGKAYYQFLELYSVLNSAGMVYLIPPKEGLQDLVYVANLGMMLPHHIKQNTFILSNFRSQPRVGEAQVGYDFFKMMGCNVVQTPHFFEGYADIKWLYGNIFVGGYNIRTDKKTYRWMEEQFGIQIIPMYMGTHELYHFDCNFFNFDGENVLCYTEGMYDDDLAILENFANVIDCSEDDSFNGSNNSVRAGSMIINASLLDTMKKSDPLYDNEVKRIDRFTKTCVNLGFEPYFVNLSEYIKSGAMVSCMVLPLNYVDYFIEGDSEKITEIK